VSNSSPDSSLSSFRVGWDPFKARIKRSWSSGVLSGRLRVRVSVRDMFNAQGEDSAVEWSMMSRSTPDVNM
jgi:hypothetical protein